ncbi:MAG: DUF4422 domain-containing protein [Eubacterium sp.]|nr:DUF4422 domain-containing protein [Eubacterium sp.]
MNKPDIKIFVVCHKPAFVPQNPYLFPIQVGAAIANKRLPDMLHDDEGIDNISNKNKSYCELTAHYYAWKNCDADYYGFFHYRRYFSFNPDLKENDGWGNIAFEKLNDNVVDQIHLNPEEMKNIITGYDMVTVKGREIQTTIHDEYGVADFQNKSDLDITLNILKEKYPRFAKAADEYMNSKTAYECNMFIMKKGLFNEYCEYLFGILEEAEKHIDITYYGTQESRVFGYLAERLTGIFCYYNIHETDNKVGFLSKTLFKDTEPQNNKIQPFFKEAVPIVLSANEKFTPYLDVMIRSIYKNSSENRNYDVIVLNTDISEKSKRIIKGGYPACNNFNIRFVQVNKYFDASKYFVDQHLSVETYYRLIIPELMPEYKKILYLDCDMVANSDVAKLYDIDLGDAVIGAAKDIDVAGQMKLNQNDWIKYATEKLGLKDPYQYFQAGVLCIDLDKLREITTAEKMIKLAISNSFRCHDQDVLNIVCKERVYYIPQIWNTLMCWAEPDGRNRMNILKMAYRTLFDEYQQARLNPHMVHFAGYQKPWHVGDCDFAEYFWKYAKESPYYPMLIRGVWRFDLLEKQNTKENAVYISRLGKLKYASRHILPYGSKRRAFFGRIYYSLKNIIKRK